MKKMIVGPFILYLFCFLCGCSGKSDSGQEITHRMVKSENYNLIEIEKDVTKLTSPQGILCRNDDILVCDAEENCIVVLNREGGYKRTVGKLGSAPLEFIRPTGITQTEQYIYVIDSGNERVQILDQNLNYLGEAALPKSPKTDQFFFMDIAVSADEDIYVSANFLDKRTSRLYKISDGIVEEASSQPFWGFLMSNGEDIYSVNTLLLYETKDIQGARTGESRLRNVTKNIDVSELPYKYAPSDFVSYENSYYCISGLTASLDRLDENGVYCETLALLPPLEDVFTYLDVSSDGMFYVTDAGSGSIYIVEETCHE